MKKNIVLLLVVVVIFAVGIAVSLKRQLTAVSPAPLAPITHKAAKPVETPSTAAAPETGDNSAEKAGTPSASTSEMPGKTASEPAASSTPVRETVAQEDANLPTEFVRLRPEHVLAKVNGVEIKLEDLVGIPDANVGRDQVMSASMYDFLLDRAVEREAIVQDANAQGVELTEEQKGELAKMRSNLELRDPNAVYLTMSQERVEFELRDAEGQILITELAKKAGLPSPYVTQEQVNTYYEEHKAEFPELPTDPEQQAAAWSAIDTQIREQLAPETEAAYQEQLKKLLEEIRNKAQIQVTELGSK